MLSILAVEFSQYTTQPATYKHVLERIRTLPTNATPTSEHYTSVASECTLTIPKRNQQHVPHQAL